MLRLLAYFAGVFLLLIVLRQLPVVGPIFRVPLLGFFLAVIVVGLVTERVSTITLQRYRLQRMKRDLGQVDTPHNQGKLGSLLLVQRRYRQAIAPLKVAAQAQPESAQWRYKLGCALLGAGRAEEAAVALGQAVEIEEEYAYGAAMLRLAEARQAAGDAAGALEVLERHARAYGTTPEAAYRRGLALRALGRKDEARASFQAVSAAASNAAKYQRREAGTWALRALVARWTV